MASQNTGGNSGHGSPGGGAGGGMPGPDAMLSVWTSWMEAMSGPAAKDWANAAAPWWQFDAAVRTRNRQHPRLGPMRFGGLAQP